MKQFNLLLAIVLSGLLVWLGIRWGLEVRCHCQSLETGIVRNHGTSTDGRYLSARTNTNRVSAFIDFQSGTNVMFYGNRFQEYHPERH